MMDDQNINAQFDWSMHINLMRHFFAFPTIVEMPNDKKVHCPGMSKREYIATQILSAMASRQSVTNPEAVNDAIKTADMLMKHLNE